MTTLTLWLYKGPNGVSVYETEKPGCDRVEFVLSPVDYGSWSQMEILCTKTVKCLRSMVSYLDRPRMTEWMIRHYLRAWSLVPQLAVEDNQLDEESFQRAMRLPGNVLSHICRAIRGDEPDEREFNEIARQCALLFGKTGSVENAHPLLSLYVTLEDMWQKFGLNYFDLQRIPIGTRNTLKRIMGLENQMRTSAMQQSDNKIDDGMKKRLGM